MLENDDELIAEHNDAREDLSSDLLHEFPRGLSNQQNQLHCPFQIMCF
jgi:hypothetical protein